MSSGATRTDEVRDSGQLPEVLQELVQGVAGVRGNLVLVLQQELQGTERGQLVGWPAFFPRPPKPACQPPAAPHPVRVDQLPHGDVYHGLGQGHHVRVLVHRETLFGLWHLAGTADEPPVPWGQHVSAEPVSPSSGPLWPLLSPPDSALTPPSLS